jgi:AraC-like DNA-binding protein
VRFWPDSGGMVMCENPERLAGHFVQPLGEPEWAVLLLRALGECCDAASAAEVADRMLAVVVEGTPPPDGIARQAVQALVATHGEMGIAAIAEGLGISLRQLERRFGAAVGLDPIQFARIRRMKGDLGPLLGGMPKTWTEVQPILPETRP